MNLELLSKLKESQIGIDLVNGQLKINAPKGALTPALLEQLKLHKEELIEFLRKKQEKKSFTAIEPVEEKEFYDLGPAQKRLYVLQQMTENNISYNMPYTIPLSGDMDVSRMEQTFKTLIERHESLRTSFISLDQSPVQRIHKDVPFAMETVHASGGDKDSIIKNFVRPFQLNEAPLLRVSLLITDTGERLLLIDMHHIITDGTSQDILRREFMALYNGASLPRLRIQYKDYSEWYQREPNKGVLHNQGKYWMEIFSDDVPVLNLPTDFPRPAIQGFEGNVVEFQLSRESTWEIKEWLKRGELTLYMGLLAIYDILLSKLSGQEDIVVGTPIAARRHADLENIMGMFVNTLAIRNLPVYEMSCEEFLNTLKQRTLGAFENQEFPFEELVDGLSIERDASRNPVFDVMFNLLNQQDYKGKVEEGESKNGTYIHTVATSKFDMNLTGVDGGEHIILMLEYSTNLFKPQTIDRIIGYFKNIASQLPVNRELPIGAIEIMGEEEKKEIVNISNGNECLYNTHRTMHGIFESTVEKYGDHIGVVGASYRDNFDKTFHITYSELNRRADILAAWLHEKGVTLDGVVGVKVERSLELIIAIMGVLKAGAGYLPIAMDYPQDRIDYMLEDSSAQFLVTQETFDELNNFGICCAPIPQAKENSLLYVIYTSGSTGKPKGVMLEHRNLVNLMEYQYGFTSIDFSRVLQFTTVSFDVSAQEIFSTLLYGGRLILTNKEEISGVTLMFDRVNKEDVKTMFMPASYLKFIIQQPDFMSLFPSSVRHIVTAGEQVIINEAFASLLRKKNIILHNHYGPSEAHVVTALTIDPKGEIPGIPTIGCPVANTSIYILDKGFRAVPVGIAGEILIGGIQVGRGYLNRPELTVEKFIILNNQGLFLQKPPLDLAKTLNMKEPVTGSFREVQEPLSRKGVLAAGGTYYRTGDLGKWTSDGNIEFLGRSDFQVKIRGFRVELGEIERVLLNYPGIKDCVVIVLEEGNKEKSLCAYIATDEKPDTKILKEYLGKELPEYMVPPYMVYMENLPLTPNRKIDRKKLPAPDKDTTETYIAPRNENEKKLTVIWGDILKMDESRISIDDNFFQLGGHSLKATILMTRIHKEFHVRPTLGELFKHPTIRSFSETLNAAQTERYSQIERVEEKEYYPLSPAQKRLYILQQMNPLGTGYNMPYTFPLNGDMGLEKIENTFRLLIDRHESLRTCFETIADEPVQRIKNEIDFSITIRDLHSKDEIDKISGNFIQPFDLGHAPLLRVSLLRLRDSEQFLLVDMHHIITDGLSQEILKKEFALLYSGIALSPLSIQYKDYTNWYWNLHEAGIIKAQEDYWLNRFYGELPVLNLPLDYRRPTEHRFAGKRVHFHFEIEETASLREHLKTNEATLYMGLLGMFNILLSKLSGQEDIIIGTPIAARRHTDLENVMGMFVNTLALRHYPYHEQQWLDFLKGVKKYTLDDFENQEYPFEELVDKVTVNRDMSRNPVFDVMFNLLNLGQSLKSEDILSNPDMLPGHHYLSSSKFDMSLAITETTERIHFRMDYASTLFNETTIDRFITYFKTICSLILVSQNIKLSEIDILSHEERHLLVEQFNGTEANYPQEKTVHELFEDQVEKIPDYIAAVGPSTGFPEEVVYITYRELNKRANDVASLLRYNGIIPDTIVGLTVSPLLEMIIGIFGILKSGGAFLPLDPEQPADRRSYILSDCSSPLLLTTWDLKNNIDFTGKTITFEEIDALPAGEKIETKGITATASNVVYTIYTSGTTGKSKGTLVEHRNLVNYVTWFSTTAKLTTNDRSLLTSSFGFDLGYTSLFPSILSGSGLHIIPRSTYLSSEQLLRYINSHCITYLKVTPSLFSAVVESTEFSKKNIGSLRLILMGGEPIKIKDVEKIHTLAPEIVIMNHYGPTETTIGCIAQRIDFEKFEEYKQRPTIGYPVSNMKMAIMDKGFQLVPIGVAGELLIWGEGVSRGYLNRPDLTAEKFITFNDQGLFLQKPPLDLAKTLDIKEPITRSFREVQEPLSRKGVLAAGGTYYRTGDLARWTGEGAIEFLGRIDTQLKIRGYRVELGEIENRLLGFGYIKEAAVVANETGAGDKYLAAYIVKDGQYKEDWGDFQELKNFLAEKLPEYMIPSYFMEIEQIPLTANGKLNRALLPSPVIKAGKQFTAPSNETEQKLVKLWAEVLSIDGQIGIEDNFFALGGHSLKATILVSRIKREFNVTVPLVELFKSPYIKTLSSIIMENATSDENRIEGMTLLKKGNRDNTIFLIHDGSGEVEGYVDFCRYLKNDWNCMGLSIGHDNILGPRNWKVEDIAANHIKKIREVQPEGPYRLGGWSIGGTIAFEMVRQLEEHNETVQYLCLFDVHPPHERLVEQSIFFTLENEKEWILGLFGDESQPMRKEIMEKIKTADSIENLWGTVKKYIEDKGFPIQQIREWIPFNLRHIIPNLDSLTLEETIYHLNLGRTLSNSRSKYMPQGKVKTDIYYFSAIESKEIIPLDMWKPYISRELNIEKIEGDHFSIFRGEQVKLLSQRFESVIASS